MTTPKETIDSVAEGLFSLAANLDSRLGKGEQFPPEEIKAILKRLQDYAADLQLEASKL